MYKNKSRIYMEMAYLKVKVEMAIIGFWFNLLFILKNKKRPSKLPKDQLKAFTKFLEKKKNSMFN